MTETRMEEVTVSRAVKRNLGNYESAEAFVALKATLESGDDAHTVAVAMEKLAGTILAEVGPKSLEDQAREKAKAGGAPRPSSS